jgi:hypothetical protein
MGSDVSPKGRSRRKRREEAMGARGEVGRLVEGSVSGGVQGRAGAGALSTLVVVVEEGPADSAEFDDSSFSEPGVRSGKQGPRRDDATSVTVAIRRRRDTGAGLR